MLKSAEKNIDPYQSDKGQKNKKFQPGLWHGQWVAVAGWQTDAFNRAPRDRWIGWAPAEQVERLHLIGNNTRFLVLGKPGVFPGLARFALTRMTERLSGDWQTAYGLPCCRRNVL